jgi:hypothetical protein
MKKLLALLALAGCGVSNDASVKLINGKVVEIPYIVELSPVGCTGTIVGPHAMITAGHCYSSGQTSKFKYKGVVYAAKMTRNPEFISSTAYNDHTLGLVSETMPGPYASIYPHVPAIGENVQLNGYGCIHPKRIFGGANGADHKLRTGATKVIAMNNYEFTTRGGPDSSALCFGDSGGPVMAVVDGQPTRGIIAINSKGDIRTTSYLELTSIGMGFFNSFANANGIEICGVNKQCD